MKTCSFAHLRFGRMVCCWLAVLALVGCATSRVDWNSRIGNYSYDQAIAELGPPDKSAKLTDGTMVAEWLTRRGYSGGSIGIMHGYRYPYYYHHYPYYHPWHDHYYTEPPSPDYYVRLTFGPDGKLQSWKRLTR